MPIQASNRYHLFVVSDPENIVFENGSKANNAAEPNHPLDVMPRPNADLVVSSGEGAGSHVTAYFGKGLAVEEAPPAGLNSDAFPGFTGWVFVG